MSGAPLSFPAQYPNIYAFGKSHALQVLPAVSPPAAYMNALAGQGRYSRAQALATPASTATDPRSGKAKTLKESRRKGAPPRIRGFSEAGGGYGTQSGKQ